MMSDEFPREVQRELSNPKISLEEEAALAARIVDRLERQFLSEEELSLRAEAAGGSIVSGFQANPSRYHRLAGWLFDKLPFKLPEGFDHQP
jgi:hypothetical protein